MESETGIVTSIDALEPRTELGAKLIALAKEIDESGIPKLTLDEIEEYLGRELGHIAEALGAKYRSQHSPAP